MVELFDCPNTNLKQGDKGEKVKLLQTHLKTLGYYVTYNGRRLVVDGSFGTYTAWAVRCFQRDTGHSQDGVFGPKTCPDLNKKIAPATSTESSTGSKATGSTTQTITKSSTTVKAVDPYKANTKKNPFKEAQSNLSIDGIRLNVSGLTFKQF